MLSTFPFCTVIRAGSGLWYDSGPGVISPAAFLLVTRVLWILLVVVTLHCQSHRCEDVPASQSAFRPERRHSLARVQLREGFFYSTPVWCIVLRGKRGLSGDLVGWR